MKNSLSLATVSMSVLFALAGCNNMVATDAAVDAVTTDTAPADTASTDAAPADAPPFEGGTLVQCTTYCTTLMTNCTGANVQYASMVQCLAACADFPVGAQADTSGNTLGCRTYHAGAAAGGAVHCPHAGPSGDSVCGENCESFCSMAAQACTGANQQFGGDRAACMTACAAYPNATGHYTSNMSTSGNTFNCRMYHLTAAAADPATHCGHIVTNSPVCM